MSVFSAQISQRWYDTSHPLLGIPVLLRPWLLSSGSLTQQLTNYAHGEFHVRPFNEGFKRIFLHESQLLAIPSQQRAWVREVHLYGNQTQPWVKARSIIPVKALTGEGLRLKYLGRRSLGSVLFGRNSPRCHRQIAKLPDGWARRSLYIWHDQPLIVQEVFLDQFCQTLIDREAS